MYGFAHPFKFFNPYGPIKLSTFRPKVCCRCQCPRTWGRPFNQSPRDYEGVRDACCVNLCQNSSCWVWPININKFTAFQISFKNLGIVTVYCIVYLHPIRNLILSCQQTKIIPMKNPLQNIEGHCMHCLKHANKITVTSLNVANYQAHNQADTADRNSKAFRATHAWYFLSKHIRLVPVCILLFCFATFVLQNGSQLHRYCS